MVRKLVITCAVIFFSLSFFIPFKIFAYDNINTHPALTDEIVDFYNLSFPDNKLTDQQKQWIVDGSVLEDVPPRWINHFYDPIYKIGWTGEKTGNISAFAIQIFSYLFFSRENPVSAVDWVNDRNLQQEYNRYEGDHTWKKGLDYYANGDEENAYKTLGYVLHLLEDQSVPEHTRNDTHAHDLQFITGDYGSPYEEYLKKYDRNSIKKLNIIQRIVSDKLEPVKKLSIEDYLISLAQYSNKYFFSKDTINDPKYSDPKIIFNDEYFGYGLDEQGKNIKLARFMWEKTLHGGIVVKVFKYGISVNDAVILDDYFDHLSRQAALYGAGVINLFQRQAQDAFVNKDYPVHLVKYDFSFVNNFNIPIISVFGELVKVKPLYDKLSGNIQSVFGQVNNLIFGNNSQDNQQAGSGFVKNDFELGQDKTDKSSTDENLTMDIATNNFSALESDPIEFNQEENYGTSNLDSEENRYALAKKLLDAKSKIINIENQLVGLSEQAKLLSLNEQNKESGDSAVFYSGSVSSISGGNLVLNNNQAQNSSANFYKEELKLSYDESSEKPTAASNEGLNDSFDGSDLNVSATSTVNSFASSTESFDAGQPTNHIVISEIRAGASNDADDEFVELYNPTDQKINLTNWSLKRKISQNSTSTKNLVLNFPATSTIFAKSFFLVAHKNYNGLTTADLFYSNNSNPLAYKDDDVILENDNNEIVDEVYYAEIPKDGSLERKANASSTIQSMAEGADEFSGNSYDTDKESDFILRGFSQPQNSFSFPEPRKAPNEPKDFKIYYSSSTDELLMSWAASEDYNGATSTLVYKIKEANVSSSLPIIETALTSAALKIDEVGRDYNFSIQAFDKEGEGSLSDNYSINVKSFLPNIYFYKDPRSANGDYLIETYYDKYPFVPDLYQNQVNDSWKILVFYLNSDPKKEFTIDSSAIGVGNSNWQSDDNILAVKYLSCSGGQPKNRALILPDSVSQCGYSGGTMNLAIGFNQLEDNHFIVSAASSSAETKFSQDDYITIAYYSFDHSSRWAGAGEYFNLVAIDKTKHYFQNNAPDHRAPSLPNNFSVENYNKDNGELMISWNGSKDDDSIDKNLSYEISYSSSTNFSFWLPAKLLNIDYSSSTYRVEMKLSLGIASSFAIRVKDDFGNFSPIKVVALNANEDGDVSLVESDSQPAQSYSENILVEQPDYSQIAKNFQSSGDYPISQEIVPSLSGYLSRIELKAEHPNGSYESNFRIKIMKGDDSIAISDNDYNIGVGEPLPDPLIFTFSQTPHLEAGVNYKVVIERVEYGMGSINFFGANQNGSMYYKVYGLMH